MRNKLNVFFILIAVVSVNTAPLGADDRSHLTDRNEVASDLAGRAVAFSGKSLVLPIAEVVVEHRATGADSWGEVPSRVFPGDMLRVRSTSVGDITTTEIWITNAGGATVATSSGGATASPISFLIPDGGSGDQPSSSYTGHVEVSNASGSDADSEVVPIVLSPQATIHYAPVAPLTGDILVPTATAEGHPGLPTGSGLEDEFQWEVWYRSDAGSSWQERYVGYGGGNGSSPSVFFAWAGGPPLPGQVDVVLDAAGDWRLDLEVYYQHGAPYVAQAVSELDISSVAATFVVEPQNPVNTSDVVLDGRGSAFAAGITPIWRWDYRYAGTSSWLDLTGVCGATSMCTIPGNDNVQFFDSGVFDFQLTLSDPSSGDTSQYEVSDVIIVDGAVVVDFTWSPQSPERGQSVGFVISGLPASELEAAQWNFGGTSCDGSPQSYTCVPDQYFNCMSWSYTYATAGTKAVQLSVISQGQVFPVSHLLTVQNAGYCPGAGVTPTLSWVPESPEMGQTTLFAISDVPPDWVESVIWNFGEAGCDGFPQDVYCVAGPFNDCLLEAYRYAEWGIRQVSMVIESGGVSYGPISETIVIQPTGSCAEDASVIFVDDFESGDTSAWAGTVG